MRNINIILIISIIITITIIGIVIIFVMYFYAKRGTQRTNEVVIQNELKLNLIKILDNVTFDSESLLYFSQL